MKLTMRAYRINLGLNQDDAANLLGITAKTLNKYEQDSTNIPNELLGKILVLYGITYQQIFLGKEYIYNVLEQERLNIILKK